MVFLGLGLLAPGWLAGPGLAQAAGDQPRVNLAVVARPSCLYCSGDTSVAALNDGITPQSSRDNQPGAYGTWPRTDMQWVQYEWSQPIETKEIEVYWWIDGQGVGAPKACRLLYWDGGRFVPVANGSGLGVAGDTFNRTTFAEVRTTKLRLEIDSDGKLSTGILEWKVYDSGKSPNFPPVVETDGNRVVMLGQATHLKGTVKDDGKPRSSLSTHWSKEAGPGHVTFGHPEAVETTAEFSKAGDYTLKLTADDGQLSSSARVQANVVAVPPKKHLDPVSVASYQITSPFWHDRTKSLMVHWIPHCIQKIEDPQTAEGGIGNFVQAGRKLAGQPDAHQTGPVYANTWVYNTVEAMCVALTIDPLGDPAIMAAQDHMRKTLADWIPKILSAQEPDGYLHTQNTIEGHPRWVNKDEHEDYQAGNFIEAAIAHHQMTGGQDRRMLDAARRLADCWVKNIGPAPKRDWCPGHEELELALVRLAQLVEQTDGPGKGRQYVELAKFLLDARHGGTEYDQSHLPVTRQYEAVGHAVRAIYEYNGMAAVAMETGDLDYHGAVRSLWDSIVNRKYYVTGGIGSGETSEGFGKDYSLPNNAYCESCANCGELFFQHRLHLIYHDARYADLYEETLYNAILGDVDLDALNYTYTNPLDASGKRYPWHVCPCCVGNIPRTLLNLPAWTYSTGPDELYVNLFIGSTMKINQVAGSPVEMVQTTDYPWSGKVAITVNPATASRSACPTDRRARSTQARRRQAACGR